MATVQARIPLLPAQIGAWYSQQLDRRSPALNIGELVRISGKLDGDLFEAAVQATVAETEALNVRFLIDRDGHPWQCPQEYCGVNFRQLAFADAADGERRAEEWMRADLAQTADLEADDPLFGSALIRVSSERFIWYVRYHQIVMDGFGWSLFARRVAEAYRALVTKTAVSHSRFQPLARVLQEDEAYRASAGYAADRDFWLGRVGDALTQAELGRRRVGTACRPMRRTIRINRGAADRLADIADSIGARPGHFLLALVGAYQSRIGATEPLVLGIPVAGRVGPAAMHTPCKLSNVLPLVMPSVVDLTLAELTRAVTDELGDLLVHQRYRGEDLRRDLAMGADESRFFGPLVNVMRFNFDLDFGTAHGSVDNLSTGPVEELSTSVFDRRDGAGLQIVMEGNPSVYTPADLATHERRLGRFLSEVCACAERDRPLSAIEVLLPEERRWLIEGWNETGARFPAGRCLHELFEDQVQRSPDAVAVVSGTYSLTYTQLDRCATELAAVLAKLGVGPDVPVVVWLDRSVATVVALLAALKAGGTYVPLDPDVPVFRAHQILADAAASVVVTTSDRSDGLDDMDATVVAVDETDFVVARGYVDTPKLARPRIYPDNLVSIYYTSGSTGTPKGVASTHRGWVNRMWWMQQFHSLRPGEAVLHKTVSSFDDSAVEIFWPLMVGGVVVLLPPGQHRSPRAILDAVIEHDIAVLQFVPTVLSGFLDELTAKDLESLGNLRHVVSSGEALHPDLVRVFFERLGPLGCRLVNQFGPTEVSIDAVAHVCSSDDAAGREVPIGRPVSNTQVYVLDRHLEPVPVGVVGDLHIGGIGLARGYWKDPAKTAGAFLPDPFGSGGRLYSTGDIGYRRPDGDLVFLGRADHQVKIRGIRVEPAEIEALLRTRADIGQVVVVKWEAASGDDRLAAYLTPSQSGNEPDIAQVRAFLSEHLPPYMVPSAFSVVAEIPQTSAGKTDRRRLPAPVPFSPPDEDDSPVATETEQLVAQVWREVLGLGWVGAHQNFFALGGHSLLATRVVARLRRGLGLDLPLELVFDHPTVASQADALLKILDGASSM